MARKMKEQPTAKPRKAKEPIKEKKFVIPHGVVNLAEMLTEEAPIAYFETWVVGETPIICHSWSEKAKREMLMKQTKAPKAGRAAKDPDKNFAESLYHITDDIYGFPVTALKKAILGVAHKDKGITKTSIMSSLWLGAEMVRVRTAYEKAICDLPLVRLYGSEPQMREDMVRVGVGLSKTADLAYRAQFTTWAIFISGSYNATVLNASQIAFLLRDAGRSVGIGDWRNEKSGIFGAFKLATPQEQKAWSAYRDGTGPLPQQSSELVTLAA